MKRLFEGKIYPGGPDEWPEGQAVDDTFGPAALELLRRGNKGEFALVVHPRYLCYEYPLKMDLLSFSRLHLRVPVRVIGLPVSVDRPGWRGSFEALCDDYRRRKGLFVVLNLEAPCEDTQIPAGQTLGSCVFRQRFACFEDYMGALRSPYRRRLRLAIERGRALRWCQVAREAFSPALYGLYRQVLARSDFPLETLDIEFFRHAPGELQALWEGERPVAFVLTQRQGSTLHFVFGGMDYTLRDRYDLYYNMLLKIIQTGIEYGCSTIDFGQTAERSKMRVGCTVQPRYLAVLCKNRLLAALLRRLVPVFTYRPPAEQFRVFAARAAEAHGFGGITQAVRDVDTLQEDTAQATGQGL